MRVRIYLMTEKGAEERHVDYNPPYGKHPSTVTVATKGSFKIKTSELKGLASVVDALDRVLGKEDC